jgi:hypothetical protein
MPIKDINAFSLFIKCVDELINFLEVVAVLSAHIVEGADV